MIDQKTESVVGKTCVLISSCDSYSDAWSPFFTLFDRYWPDCDWPVFLLSNFETWPSDRIHPLAIGEDHSWSTNLRIALEELQPRSIIYLQEDYFLQNPVDMQRLSELNDFALENGVGYVRLAGSPDPDLAFENPFGLGELSRETKFRCSLQGAWWDTDVLLKLLVDDETGWDMEMKGTERAKALPQPFLGVNSDAPLVDYIFETAILKGRWMPQALRLCRQEGIELDLSRRPVQPQLPLLLKRFRKSRPVSSVKGFFRSFGRKAG